MPVDDEPLETVSIAARFAGPPDSANGGYACGTAAEALGHVPTQVTLRRPPPLERALRVQHDGASGSLLDGDDVIAEARSMPVTIEPPVPISHTAAVEALEHFDVERYAALHAFPGCFTCGPHRDAGDGLRIFPARPEHTPDLVVCPWQPDASLLDADGLVDRRVLWAALDCPSGLTWFDFDGDEPPATMVLGRLTAAIHRQPTAGERLVVAGWPTTAEGRKHHAGSVIWSSDGDVLAIAAATWIALNDDQQVSFRSAETSREPT